MNKINVISVYPLQQAIADGILVEGFSAYFTSTSLTAMATIQYNVNGWNFWEFRDPNERKLALALRTSWTVEG